MLTQRIKLIQVLAELIIPILGYFYWDWSFYFIALFYFLDLFANSTIIHLKVTKFPKSKEHNKIMFFHYFLFLVLLTSLFILGVLLCQNLNPSFNFTQETIDFIWLTEFGIPQGFLLLPLIFYTSYMQYKMEFLAVKKYESITLTFLLKKHLLSLIFCVALVFFSYLFTLKISVSELIAVIILISLTSFYSFRYKR